MTMTSATDGVTTAGVTTVGIAAGRRKTTRPPGTAQTAETAFADLLGPAGTGAAAATSQQARTGTSAKPSLIDAGYDPAGKIFHLDKFARALRAETADFNDALNFRLQRAGVDTSVPITLDVDTDGTIAVRGDHPDKDTIERLFANDPEFANRYREISSGHTMIAKSLVATRYEIALREADDKEEEERIRRRFEAFDRRLDNVAGMMTVSGGLLSSTAMDLTTSFLQLPAWAAG